MKVASWIVQIGMIDGLPFVYFPCHQGNSHAVTDGECVDHVSKLMCLFQPYLSHLEDI